MAKFSEMEVIKAFLAGSRKKQYGNYVIDGNTLKWRAQCSEEVKKCWDNNSEFINKRKELRADIAEVDGKLMHGTRSVMLESLSFDSPEWSDIKLVYYDYEIIAHRVSHDFVIGNASILPLVGRSVAYGHERKNSKETEIQRLMRSIDVFTMIPLAKFSITDLDNFKLVFKEPPNTFTLGDNEIRIKHSATVFEVSGITYLYDIDRKEILSDFYNPFVTELPHAVANVTEAYDALKPESVKQAEAKGLTVVRHGPMFFISCAAPILPVLNDAEKITVLGYTALHRYNSIVDNQVIKALFPEESDEDNEDDSLTNKVKALINGLPQPADFKNNLKRTISVKSVVRGKYCTGIVSSPKRANIELKCWYEIVPRVGLAV